MVGEDRYAQPFATCGCARPRRTVIDFVLDPCRKSREPLPPASGERVASSDGAAIRFHASLRGDKIADLKYEATTCATLTAYAELLGDLVVGRPVAQAAVVAPRMLVASLPGVPPSRQERALIVAQAWSSAVARAWQAKQVEGNNS